MARKYRLVSIKLDLKIKLFMVKVGFLQYKRRKFNVKLFNKCLKAMDQYDVRTNPALLNTWLNTYEYLLDLVDQDLIKHIRSRLDEEGAYKDIKDRLKFLGSGGLYYDGKSI